MFAPGKEEKCTIVLSTHDQTLIKLADQTIYLLDARVSNQP